MKAILFLLIVAADGSVTPAAQPAETMAACDKARLQFIAQMKAQNTDGMVQKYAAGCLPVHKAPGFKAGSVM